MRGMTCLAGALALLCSAAPAWGWSAGAAAAVPQFRAAQQEPETPPPPPPQRDEPPARRGEPVDRPREDAPRPRAREDAPVMREERPAPRASAQGREAARGTPAGSPMIEVSKGCPSLRYLGREATFEIVVANRGNAAAGNVVVTDPIPAGVDFLGADGGGQREGNAVVWRIGTLEAGQSRTLRVNVRCSQITTVRNTTTVTWCGEARAECEFPVRGVPAILLECVDDPDPIEVGGQVTYTITVTNQGSQEGTNIVVECTLPPEQELVSARGATNGQGEGRMVRFAPLPSLAPKMKAVYTVTVKGVAVGDVRFGVSIKSDQIATPVSETESTHIY